MLNRPRTLILWRGLNLRGSIIKVILHVVCTTYLDAFGLCSVFAPFSQGCAEVAEVKGGQRAVMAA